MYDAKLKVQAGMVVKICNTTPTISSINLRYSEVLASDLGPFFNAICKTMYDLYQNLICIMQKLLFLR